MTQSLKDQLKDKLPDSKILQQEVMSFLADKMQINDALTDTCQYIGFGNKQQPGFHKPILIKLVKLSDRDEIWLRRSRLKNTEVVLKEDLPIEMEANVRTLVRILHNARSQDMKASLNKDVLHINGEKYTVANLHTLPNCLQPRNTSTLTTDKHVLFWGKDSQFSNFNTEFQFNIDSIVYNCVEQFYCAEKANFFNDNVAKEKIMAQTNPALQKKQTVKGYKEKEWQVVCEKYMKIGLRAKFGQNELLKQMLLKTEEKLIGEASPFDRFWGLGMRLTDKNVFDTKKWGKNILGRLIMEVRDELK